MDKKPDIRLMRVLTMGCRVNQFESELMQNRGSGHGFCPAKPGEVAQLVIVNTCSVTGESDRQARQMIRRAARENPGARIIVTGCYAQRDPATLRALPNVAMVLGQNEKKALWQQTDPLNLFSAVGELLAESKIQADNVDNPENHAQRPLLAHFGDKVRAYLQVQDGCDRQCTYCLIPAVRGPSRCLPPAYILAQAQKFIASGYQELVLTGIDLGSYGRSTAGIPSLSGLVRQILGLPGLRRLRLSSIDPTDLDGEMVDLLGTSSILSPHLHLSIQSGDDLILKRMGRKTTRDAILKVVAHLRKVRADIVLGADLIVGFPTESTQAFQQTLSLVAEADLALLHVFRYSNRPGTPAAAMPTLRHIADHTMRHRAAQLREAGDQVLQKVAENQLGSLAEVLVEAVRDGWALGKTAAFLPVRFPWTPGVEAGQFRLVTLKMFDTPSGEIVGGV